MFEAAILYSFLTGVVVLFQLALAVGLPWGAASMGGKFPGKYPPKMRAIAVVNALVLIFLNIILLSKAQVSFLQFSDFSRLAIWLVVGFAAISTVVNTITPSKIERIWAPVAASQFITSLIVALN